MALVITGDFTFKVDYDKQTAILTHYDSNDAEIGIPEKVNDCIVISVAQDVFKDKQKIRKVFLPDTIQYIGARAFMNSTIESLWIEHCGNNTANKCHIYHSAFMNCKHLEQVHLPVNTVFSDWNIFANCESLKNIEFDNVVGNIPKYTFLNCRSLKKIWIGRPISIKEKAFFGCYLQEVIETESAVTYADDFYDAIKYATIRCKPQSHLSSMVYHGNKVVFMK